MKILILLAALCSLSLTVSASIIPSPAQGDSWSLRLDGAEAATVLKGLQTMKGTTQSTIALTQFECHQGLSTNDRACMANLGDFMQGAIDGDLALQVAKVYQFAAQMIFANQANRLNQGRGDMIEATAQCQQSGASIACLLKFAPVSAGGF